ncbi:MAG TPA: M48 family metallopeptidase, partial [Longimicrobiales bacterium]|nr:M48 family metallopeptidase [Longimicrobiales bacterium]
MDFFQAQESARARSRVLVALFLGAVVAIIVTVYVVIQIVLAATGGMAPGFYPELFAVVAIGTSLLIAGGSGFRTLQLRSGGASVAEMLGGRRVSPDTRDIAERRLLNVVEEMAIASGMPVPAVFVLDAEQGINAFAAGYTIHDAAVAVTRGTLERLDRDELQGVIAHEFSHILNGDMRLNVRLIGLLFGILLLSVVGRGLLRGAAYGGRGRKGGGGQVALIGLALTLLGFVGVFFGRLIKAAVSRQREFLADAAAVQFTRNPGGLADALKKIGGATARGGSLVRNHHAEELSHLFFAEGVQRAFAGGALSTHPPLDERIRRIEPNWDGKYIADGSAVDAAATAPGGRDRRSAVPAPGAAAAF